WNVMIGAPTLRMDQRLVVNYSTAIQLKELHRSGNSHDLFLMSRVSSPDLEWLNAFSTLHQVMDPSLPNSFVIHLSSPLFVQPNDYILWLMLYDHATNKHNVAKRRLHVNEIPHDPLPYVYDYLPLIEFPA